MWLESAQLEEGHGNLTDNKQYYFWEQGSKGRASASSFTEHHPQSLAHNVKVCPSSPNQLPQIIYLNHS